MAWQVLLERWDDQLTPPPQGPWAIHLVQALHARFPLSRLLIGWRNPETPLPPDLPAEILSCTSRPPRSPASLRNFVTWALTHLSQHPAHPTLALSTLLPATLIYTWSAPAPYLLNHLEPTFEPEILTRIKIRLASLGLPRTLCTLERRALTDPHLLRLAVPTADLAQQFHQYYHLPQDRLVLIPPAAPALAPDQAQAARSRCRSALHIADHQTAILVPVTGLSPPRLAGLLRGFAQARHQRPNLVLLLAGHLCYHFHHLAVQAAVRPHVRLVPLAHSWPQILSASDLFLLPWRYHPCHPLTIQALALGIPVITSLGDGASLWLVSSPDSSTHVPGLALTDPCDPAALTPALLQLTQPSNLLAARQAAIRLAPHLAFSRTVDQLHQLLQNLPVPADPGLCP